MRILAAADLHWGHTEQGDRSAVSMAQDICRTGGDVLILAGDIAAPPRDRFYEAFGLFHHFCGEKLFTAGNHDIWVNQGSSLDQYEKALPEYGRACGFRYLDADPVVLDRVGFAGSIGWYDFAFLDADLGAPEESYRAKLWPGVCSYNDARFVKWDLSDEQFLESVTRKLAGHIESIQDQVESIVCAVHHIPFENMLPPRPGDTRQRFVRAFLGSPRIGEMLLGYPKVRHLFSGHSHTAGEFTNGHIRCFLAGSTYEHKTYLAVEI